MHQNVRYESIPKENVLIEPKLCDFDSKIFYWEQKIPILESKNKNFDQRFTIADQPKTNLIFNFKPNMVHFEEKS